MSSLTPSVSPLRQRMIDDMRMRKFNGKTQIHYIRAVRRLAAFLKRSPDTATAEDLRAFQLHMVDTGTSPPTINSTLSGLKFFFDVTLGHAELMVTRYKAMTLDAGEFMRRFLLHVLPGGFHRIRHYGLLANCNRTASLALARQLLQVPPQDPQPCDDSLDTARPTFICPHCGHAMTIVQTFTRGETIRAPPHRPTP